MVLRSKYSDIPLDKIEVTPFDKVTRKDLDIISTIACAAEHSDFALHRLGACVLLSKEGCNRV